MPPPPAAPIPSLLAFSSLHYLYMRAHTCSAHFVIHANATANGEFSPSCAARRAQRRRVNKSSPAAALAHVVHRALALLPTPLPACPAISCTQPSSAGAPQLAERRAGGCCGPPTRPMGGPAGSGQGRHSPDPGRWGTAGRRGERGTAPQRSLARQAAASSSSAPPQALQAPWRPLPRAPRTTSTTETRRRATRATWEASARALDGAQGPPGRPSCPPSRAGRLAMPLAHAGGARYGAGRPPLAADRSPPTARRRPLRLLPRLPPAGAGSTDDENNSLGFAAIALAHAGGSVVHSSTGGRTAALVKAGRSLPARRPPLSALLKLAHQRSTLLASCTCPPPPRRPGHPAAVQAPGGGALHAGRQVGTCVHACWLLCSCSVPAALLFPFAPAQTQLLLLLLLLPLCPAAPCPPTSSTTG